MKSIYGDMWTHLVREAPDDFSRGCGVIVFGLFTVLFLLVAVPATCLGWIVRRVSHD